MGRVDQPPCWRCGKPLGSYNTPCSECGPIRRQVGVCAWCLGETQGRTLGYCGYRCSALASRKLAHKERSPWPGMVCAQGLHLVIDPGARLQKRNECASCAAIRREQQAEVYRASQPVYPACRCGCGQQTKAADGYRTGHAPLKLKPCVCGCGRKTRSDTPTHYVTKAVTRPCRCGCGQRTWSRSGYYRDHGKPEQDRSDPAKWMRWYWDKGPLVPCGCGCEQMTQSRDGYRPSHNPLCPRGHVKADMGEDPEGGCRECYRQGRRTQQRRAKHRQQVHAEAAKAALDRLGIDTQGMTQQELSHVWVAMQTI